ncbi:MAG: hypothetical protein K2P76_03110 [Lachnospiraceae bacterium]|nr:hypothetical protein [Lachnospiraceae bacterium]
MPEEYFKNALKNFSQDMANGGAIRHLWNRGYSIRQIMEHLDFPANYERVQNVVWEHLIARGVIRLTKPEPGEGQEQVSYVKEYDRYGRTSFRRVTQGILQEEMEYVPCDIGLVMHRDRALYDKILACLKERQREYAADIPWKRMRIYHKRDENIEGIMKTLKGTDFFTAFFPGDGP